MGTAERNALRDQLRRDVLTHLRQHPGWIRYDDLIRYVPEGRLGVIPELDGMPLAYGSDFAQGSAWDAGPSGEPDLGMLGDVLGTMRRRDLLTEEGYPAGTGRSIRLYDPGEPVGLQEIAERLGVKRATADQWRQREVLPEPEAGTVGGRPWWRWGRIREWAIDTGRSQQARRTLTLLAVPVPERPERMPEPLPEGAVWADVRGLASFSDPAVQAWADERIRQGFLVMATVAGGGKGYVYGRSPHLSVTVTDSLAATVSGPDHETVRATTRRGWEPLIERAAIKES